MIDLHAHTTCSDGTDSPLALVKKAAASGITVLGVTDHDSTAGWVEATSALHGNLKLALGAEVSCLTTDGISVHMLGLLFDGENQALQQLLSDSRDTRIPRMKKMIENLQGAGYDITLEDVHAATPAGATVGRPHLADALVVKKIVKSRDEAFTDLLNNDSPFYVSHFAPTPEDSIRAIRAAGGVAVIAHPGRYNLNAMQMDELYKHFKDIGGVGIEVITGSHSPDQYQTYGKIAQQYGFLASRGSDFHDPDESHIDLGTLPHLPDHLTPVWSVFH